MAKISFGGIVSDARNKLGDVVYSRGRGGAYARGWIRTPNPNTTNQQANRALTTAIVARWANTLTPNQRQSWNAYASTQTKNNSKMPGGSRTGNNWFVSTNLVLQNWIGTFLDDPPPNLNHYQPGPPTTTSITVATAHFDIGVTTVPTGADVVGFWATNKLSHGITRIYRGLTALDLIAAGDPNPKNFWATYTARFGAPIVGDHIGIKVTGINAANGQISYPWYEIAIAT